VAAFSSVRCIGREIMTPAMREAAALGILQIRPPKKPVDAGRLGLNVGQRQIGKIYVCAEGMIHFHNAIMAWRASGFQDHRFSS
jgi:hypothetical protein